MNLIYSKNVLDTNSIVKRKPNSEKNRLLNVLYEGNQISVTSFSILFSLFVPDTIDPPKKFDLDWELRQDLWDMSRLSSSPLSDEVKANINYLKEFYEIPELKWNSILVWDMIKEWVYAVSIHYLKRIETGVKAKRIFVSFSQAFFAEIFVLFFKNRNSRLIEKLDFWIQSYFSYADHCALVVDLLNGMTKEELAVGYRKIKNGNTSYEKMLIIFYPELFDDFVISDDEEEIIFNKNFYLLFLLHNKAKLEGLSGLGLETLKNIFASDLIL